jgi:hypothetical protein
MHLPRVSVCDSRPVPLQPAALPKDAGLSARFDADKWTDLEDKWHAAAIRALDEHGHADDDTCTRCGEHWPCAAAHNAAFALDVHATP